MRYVIVSDIHGNLQALEAVLSAIGRLGIERIICLGDIVGYGGDPSACIEIIRNRCAEVILGNHDAAVVGLTSIARFNPVAQAAVLWTRRVLSAAEKGYLEALPLRLAPGPFEIVHSTPDDPAAWKYLLTEDQAGPLFGCFDSGLLFYGHTHFPLIFERDPQKSVNFRSAGDLSLLPEHRYIVNAGSVGQPRDGDPRASFAVYDSQFDRLTFQREPYDIVSAQERILANGLPRVLAARLAYGS